MRFIHDGVLFSEGAIRERARRYGFSDPLPVELFLWCCEVAAQLQSELDGLVLKGGAAVQLHLPVEMQRGSVDVDFVGALRQDDIAEAMWKVHERLEKLEFKPHKPKHPKMGIPLVTYFVSAPALVPSRTGGKRELKVEFLLEDFGLPVETVTKVETFAAVIEKIKCYSVTSLIGDKLLTLAENTIGVREPADVPKQIYDVALLSEQHKMAGEQLAEVVGVIERLTQAEAGYRNLKLTPEDALVDVAKTMEKYSVLDTAGADREIKRNITNFQQFYIGESQRRPWYEWCVWALRIRFLTHLILSTFEGQSTINDAASDYALAIKLSRELKGFSGEKAKELKRNLLELACRETPFLKELKGKPVHRVFWHVVNRENLSVIQSMV